MVRLPSFQYYKQQDPHFMKRPACRRLYFCPPCLSPLQAAVAPASCSLTETDFTANIQQGSVAYPISSLIAKP
jgi:hypothetical protein